MSKANTAYKFRIYPNSEQQILIAKTFGCVRFVYNHMLADRIEYYENTGSSLNNTPAPYKKEFSFLKEVDSLALANAQLNLNTAYRNFFRDKAIGFPKYKKKKFSESYTTNKVGNNIRFEGAKLRLPKIGLLKIKMHRCIPDNYILKSVTVSRTPSGKFYASILFEYDTNIHPVKVENAVGLDFSMHELYVASDGTSAEYPRFFRAMQDKLAVEQRKLSHCKPGSNNYHKQKHKVAVIHEKIANQRKDFLHKASREITNQYDAVCIEDLNMKSISQSLHFGKSVADNAWGIFVSFLNYKLAEQGKTLVKVDKFYPSSKTCSHCGNKKETLSLSERTYTCEVCGTTLDRDLNAAINIRSEGLRLLKA